MLAISVNVAIESELTEHVLDSVHRSYVLLFFYFGCALSVDSSTVPVSKETVRWVT